MAKRSITCPTCHKQLAWGQLLSTGAVEGIDYDSSVVSHRSVYNGIGITGFVNARKNVKHIAKGKKVEHTI